VVNHPAKLEPEEVEPLRVLAELEPAEPHHPALLRRELQPVLRQPFRQHPEEPLGLLLPLEREHDVLLLPSLVQARPLPSETRRAPGRAESGFLQWIWSTLGSIWTKGGAPADLNGSTTQTENGSQLDPSAQTSPGKNAPGSLAALHAEQGKTAEVRELAREMVKIFKAQEIYREALAAALLFRRAAVRERATPRLAREIAAFLEKARHALGLRFEFGGAAAG
jgi:hypothetical protein